MLITKKMLLAVTLVAALVGGGLGSLITHSANRTEAANDYQTTANTAPTTTAEQQEAANASKFGSSAEQTAYREGFAEGYNSCASAANNGTLNSSVASTYRAPARRYSSSTRRVYYDYNSAPRGRSFWSKHRDKLTMAIGTGAGAALGGLIGGKKGAGIGALAGLGGSALYTYKLRRRTPRY